ncbi:MAG TPA: response regulator transcription factor [Dermatophilaceae bacterium]|nr:response regulator transcription factor [Dermatophilaceae bacterium]
MKLVLCDDHLLLLEGLRLVLTRAGHDVVTATADPGEAVAAVRRHRPDACLLDLHFPHGFPRRHEGPVVRRGTAGRPDSWCGTALIDAVRTAHPGTRVVILSGTAEPGLVAEALSRGAHGFVGKQRSVAEIVSTLERAVGSAGGVGGGGQEQPSDPLWVLRFLTDREWQVLRCILDGNSTEQISAVLGVRRSTARTHVQNLLTKMGVSSRLQLAALVTAHGESVMRDGGWQAS